MTDRVHLREWLFTKTRVPVSALFGNLAAGAAIKEKVSSIMNDPRVVALHYCIEHESSVDYSNAEPVDHEEEGFRIRIEERLVCFEMKDDQPTVDSALEVVNSYISNWELDDALTSKPDEFKLRFVRPEIVDRKPTPGEHEVSADPVFWEFTTSATVTKRRPYPKPPVGVSLKRNDDVLLMLSRYEDLCKKRDKLPAVAQFCLTMLEKLAGGRQKAAKKFAIGKKVLDKVGELGEKGGPAMARTAKHLDKVGELGEKGGPAMARTDKRIDEKFTPGETRFLECAVKVFIRRVAEEAQSPGGPFRKITIKDFPEVWPGHQQGCA